MLTYIGISGRNDIPRFLNEEGLTGTGVEIGTHRGHYADILLRTWRGKLICVDPWDNAPDYADQVPLLSGGQDRSAHETEARQLLAKYGTRCKILPYTSMDALQFVPDNSLDFVYVDGNHKMGFVIDDIDKWMEKVKPGGYVFGHDFICPGETSDNPNGGWGAEIQPAVLTYTMLKMLDVAIIPDGTEPWSYAIRKPL
jgi:hypothetical protein